MCARLNFDHERLSVVKNKEVSQGGTFEWYAT